MAAVLLGASVVGNVVIVRKLGIRRLVARLRGRAYYIVADQPATDRYNDLPLRSNGVIFVGDSIISQLPVADLFTNLHNRGIGGHTVSQIADRLPRYLSSHPQMLVILAGTNDLLLGTSAEDALVLFERMCTEVIDKERPPTVLVLSLPPLNNEIRRDVRFKEFPYLPFNRGLERICVAHTYVYLDIVETLRNSGLSEREISVYGVHLTAAAYVHIQPALARYIRSEPGRA